MDEIKQMDLESKDLVAERIEQMKALFPEIATESDGSIDFEKLRLILGDEVDEGDERYAFTWPGKADAIRQAQTVSTATLRPCPEESVDWDTTQNLYIEGDNLEVLKLLQRGYHSKVKMIYIDPPYNTGHDFVYKDRFGETVENYKEQAGLSGQSNAETSGSYHSNWCSMIYPRLKLARELLTEDGLIFISIDDNELENLKIICNEVFGESNLVDNVIWKKRYGGGAKEKYLVTLHEYVLVYCKDISKLGEIFVPLTQESAERYYTKRDSHYAIRGGYRTHPLEAGKAMDSRPNLVYPIPAPDGTMILPKRQWLWGKERTYSALEKGELEIVKGKNGEWVVSSKQYLRDENGVMRPGKKFSIIDDVYSQHGTNEMLNIMGNAKIFSYPKPSDFLRQLIEIPDFCDGDIVLDFFSGSGSTAHGVFIANANDGKKRKFILVQLPEICPEDSDAAKAGYRNICEIGKERIRRVGKALGKDQEDVDQAVLFAEERPRIDTGFRVLKLDSSGINHPDPGQLMLDRIKPDRTDQDIIFEMMLKWGLELTYPIEKISVAGYKCYSVAGDALICCMSEGLTVQVIQEIADMEPDRVLMLDSILDDTLKLNALQIFKRTEEKTQKKIDLRTV